MDDFSCNVEIGCSILVHLRCISVSRQSVLTWWWPFYITLESLKNVLNFPRGVPTQVRHFAQPWVGRIFMEWVVLESSEHWNIDHHKMLHRYIGPENVFEVWKKSWCFQGFTKMLHNPKYVQILFLRLKNMCSDLAYQMNAKRRTSIESK